jgi:uncharacterized damage-inducible protein DinB
LETVAELAELFSEVKEDYAAFFAAATEETLAQNFTYRNSEGNEYTNNYRDILHHVFFHSAQHRGQIIAEIRAAGEFPPYIDYIGFLRRN